MYLFICLCSHLPFSINTSDDDNLCESSFQIFPQDSHLAGLQDVDLLIINGVSVLYQEAITLILHLQKNNNNKKQISVIPCTQTETSP